MSFSNYRHTGAVVQAVAQSDGNLDVGAGGPTVLGSSVVTEGTFTKTEYIFDITGMASVATDADVIGGTGAAYILKLDGVTGTNVQFAELQCLEAPTTGEVDIDVLYNASGTIEADGAGGSDKLINTNADWTAFLLKYGAPVDLAAKPYLYLAVGTSSTPTAGTYDAGIYKLTLYTV